MRESQRFRRWFTEWPSTHENAGRAVEVMPVADEMSKQAREAAIHVVRVYRGLANDDNDGEFALWSQDDLIVAILALDKALGFPALSEDEK